MPEAGGTTTQSGTFYQNTITAGFLGRLLQHAFTVNPPQHLWVTEVRAEAPEYVDDTVVGFADGHKILIQAKEDVTKGDAAWGKLWRDFEGQYWSEGFDASRGDSLQLYVGEFRTEHRNLREICQRARGHAASTVDWLASLSREQSALISQVKDLLNPEHTADADIHGFLRCIEVEIRPLLDLEELAISLYMMPCNVSPKALLRLLRDRVGENARYRVAMDASSLRYLLETEEGIQFNVPPDLEYLHECFRTANTILRQWSHTFGRSGGHVERTEVHDLLAWALLPNEGNIGNYPSPTGELAVLVDVAGRGKTVALRDLLMALEADDRVFVLAIKADIQLGGVTDDTTLCTRLSLPDTLERCTRRLAALRPVVILIDQIDALSLSLSRNQDEVDFLLSLISILRGITGVRLIISCRRFDLHSDPKLRQLKSEREFTLSSLPMNTVRSVVEQLGGNYNTLPAVAQRLLQTPLHLDLYSRALERHEVQTVHNTNIRSLQDLYRLLWESLVIVSLPQGSPSQFDRAEVLRHLAIWMRDNQNLGVPDLAFLKSAEGANSESLAHAATYLASAGLLLHNSGYWSFFHQTFFDFIVAMVFVEEGKSLSDTILEGEQGLTSRPLMLQVLEFLRGGPNQNSYTRELSNLLITSDKLRPHLRNLLLRWFGSLESPSEAEWNIARRLLAHPNQGVLLLGVIRGNMGWFKHLLNNNYVDTLLEQESEFIDNTVMPYFGSLINNGEAQTEIARLLLHQLGQSEVWDSRILYIVNQIQKWETIEGGKLFEQLFAKQFVTMSLTDPNAWSAISLLDDLKGLAESYPRTALRVAIQVMDAEIDALEKAEKNEQIAESVNIAIQLENFHGRREPLMRLNHAGTLSEALNLIASSEPALFLRKMLPWLEAVVKLTSPPDDDWPYFASDLLTSSSFAPNDFAARFLDAFRTALSTMSLAENSASTPDSVLEVTIRRLVLLPYIAPQELVAQVYTVAIERHSSEALKFLLYDHRRLELGVKDQYESRQLITALYPKLNHNDQVRLENMLLAHTGIKGFRGLVGLKYGDIAQLNLLRAVPAGLLTARGVSRLLELERKHEGYRASDNPPQRYAVMAEFTRSPIPADVAAKMTDKAWLRAMTVYDVNHEKHSKNILRGGPRQLAPLLAARTRAEPQRFYRLATAKVPTDVDTEYQVALISGLTDAVLEAMAPRLIPDTITDEELNVVRERPVSSPPDARPEWLFEVALRFLPTLEQLIEDRDSSASEVGRATARALERYATSKVLVAPVIPDSLTNILESYVRDLPIGKDEYGWEDMSSSDTRNFRPYNNFLNSLRGVAFRALTAVLSVQVALGNTAAIERWWSIVIWVSQDHSPALHAGVIDDLTLLSDKNPEQALDIFVRLMSSSDKDILLTAPSVYEFLYRGIHRFYEGVLPFIRILLESSDERVQEDGAKLACIGAIVRSDKELSEFLLSGPSIWRRTATLVLSANVASGAYGSTCIGELSRLLEDSDHMVLERIDGVFGRLKDTDLYKRREFLDAYFDSPAPWCSRHGGWGGYLLETAAPLEPDWTLTTIAKVIDSELVNKANGSEIDRVYRQRRPLHVGEHLIRAVLQIYTQPDSDATRRENAMAIFDQLTERYPYEANSILTEWDER